MPVESTAVLRITGCGMPEGRRQWVFVDSTPASGSMDGMSSLEAITSMRGVCNQLSTGITSLHAQVPKLGSPPAQAEIIKALFELTKQVEVVKKHLLRLEKGDGSTLV